MLSQIINIVAPLVLIVLAGLLYGRRHRPDISAANRMNMDIFCPALIFSVLASTELALSEYASLAAAGAIVVLGSGLLVWPFCRWLGFKPRTLLPPMMFNNAGNLGIPLLLLALGEEVMAIAIVLFVVEMVLHFSVGIYYLNPQTKLLSSLKTPVIIAALLGFALNFAELSLPQAVALPIEMLGQISIPLMLFTLGIRLTEVNLKDWRVGVFGALACPISGLLCAGLAYALLPLSPLQTAALFLFASLPPAVLNYMVAEQYKVEPKVVASIVMLGNITSLLVMPLVLYGVLSMQAT